eukprot:11197498-Lingulodinium_polyedra.AAC.1
MAAGPSPRPSAPRATPPVGRQVLRRLGRGAQTPSRKRRRRWPSPAALRRRPRALSARSFPFSCFPRRRRG